MLRWRLLSAAILISILVSLLVVDYRYPLLQRPGLWLLPIVVAFVMLATGEMISLLAATQQRPVGWTTFSGTLLVIAGAAAPMAWIDYPADCILGKLGWPLAGLAIGICLACVGEMLRYEQPGGVTIRIALSAFTMTYVGLLSSFLILLRLFHSSAWGMAAVVSTIAIVKVSDAGAYFVGRALGRHPMTPKISPKKTIEGGVGGILAAILASWLFFQFLIPHLFVASASSIAWWRWALYGVILAVAGMLGDLAESLLKRDLGQKDSSRWLPGLGGILDVLDALLFAAPVAYLCWAAGLIGPLAK